MEQKPILVTEVCLKTACSYRLLFGESMIDFLLRQKSNNRERVIKEFNHYLLIAVAKVVSFLCK